MIEDEIVKEALLWLKTPYHHMGRIKGAGVDCGTILIEVYSAVGLIPNFDTGFYPIDWALHRSEERYLNFIDKYCYKVDKFKKGDIALYKFGRCVSHSGIVINDNGDMVHALNRVGVTICHYLEGDLNDKFYGFYRVGKENEVNNDK